MIELQQGQELFRKMAAQYVVKAADEKVAKGEAEWALDPEVTGVVGLIVPGTRRAMVVVYISDEDFECDEELLGLI